MTHARGRGRPARWSLRSKLLVLLVTLLALVCVVVGVATALLLRGFLVGRLDSQLVSAGGRSVMAGGGPPGGPDDGGAQDTGAQFLLAPGQAAGTLGARISGGAVTAAGVLGNDGSLKLLPGSVASVLATVPVDGHVHTVDISGQGDYRVLATMTANGDALITGLPLSDLNRTLNRLIMIEIAVAVAALLVATAAGFLIVRRTLKPLRRVAATAARVSVLPLAQGQVALSERLDPADVDSRTEVGQVAGAVNRLLDHVSNALSARQASETRVRQFVADASHELRTPLAAISGYAELTRRSREVAPPDIAHAMSRVESETARMSRMVEDLLLLARLDEGRPLELETVDLTHLVLDAVSDATAAGRDQEWRVNLPDRPVELRGDASRLHQALANLLANARTHTPAGTTITTALTSSSPATISITVLDDGPGIPAEVLPNVFERFARGGSARANANGSTGLGLAIVQAIVHAHGGSVHLTSRPGQTAFVIRLPVAGPRSDTAAV
jgi:two-component system OmpR family sensor kinase